MCPTAHLAPFPMSSPATGNQSNHSGKHLATSSQLLSPCLYNQRRFHHNLRLSQSLRHWTQLFQPSLHHLNPRPCLKTLRRALLTHHPPTHSRAALRLVTTVSHISSHPDP